MNQKVFRDHPGFPNIQDAMAATPGERVESIGRFIERQVARFQATLKPRERANCGHGDTVNEIVVKLLEKDSEWNPERGKYITFAGKIIERELYSVRERARVVPSPRNSSGRMREYAAEELAGTITRRRAKTAADIRRTTTCPASLHHTYCALADDPEFQLPDHRTPEPPEVASDHELSAAASAALKSAIRALPLLEAFVLGRLSGLWGAPKQSVFQLAWETQREEAEIRNAWAKAMLLIRRHLVAAGHSATDA